MPTKSSTSSAPLRQFSRGAATLGIRLSRKGATRRMPIASPVHHTAQVGQKLLEGTAPDTTSTVVPNVALTDMPTSAPRPMIAAASRMRSSSRRNPASFSSSLAKRGARVLPTAMIAAPSGDGPSGRFTARAPTNMAGHTRLPNTSRATRAMPVGGQTGVTWPCTSARSRLR